MLDGVSLDQLRTFIAAAEAGSFSAAGRRLKRAQSVVSQTLANLEGQIGVRLFDRSGRYPKLTPQGQALLADARAVTEGMDVFKARAKDLADGLEAELSIAVNVLFPTAVLTAAVEDFQHTFANTPLRVAVEGLGAVIEPVLDRRCHFGMSGPLGMSDPNLVSERLLAIEYLMVASPQHPLSRTPAPIPRAEAEKHVQLVLTDRSSITEGRDLRVFSSKTWRLSDLGAKHAFLRSGLGWGGMPRHMVEADFASGVLVPLVLEDAEGAATIPLSAVYRADSPPGPAGRWLIDRLKVLG